VPESKGRKKAEYTPPPRASKSNQPSSPAFVWIMVAAFVIGLAWIVTFYVSGSNYPIPFKTTHYWNLVIGFAIVLSGFVMATRWR
jgi:Cell division protein CrgA